MSSYETQQHKPLASSEKQALIDSILLQLYCACVSYCNELLSHHGKPALKSDCFNLINLLNDKEYEGVSELYELRLLYTQKQCGLSKLCSLFEDLMAIGSKEEQEGDQKRPKTQASNADYYSASSMERNNLIDIVTIDSLSVDSPDLDLSDIDAIKHLVITLQELIDRQREYLLEY
jgi:hypothetical protein